MIPTSLAKYLDIIRAIIKKIFKITGAAAPDQNLPLVFKEAAKRAVKIINIKYGKMIFAYGIASSNLITSSTKPGAIK